MDLDLEMELWDVFGSMDVCDRAPEPLVEKVLLMLVGKRIGASEKQQEWREKQEAEQRALDSKRRAAEQFGHG